MNGPKKTALALLFGGALCAVAAPAHADRWYNSRAAWGVYGFGAGVVTGSILTDYHYRHHRPVYRPHYPAYTYCPPPRRVYYAPPPVVYCPPPRVVYAPPVYHYPPTTVIYYNNEATTQYRSEPVASYRDESRVVYYEPAPQPYTSYREERVWPFYRKVEAETIPQLSQPQGRPAAVSLADRYKAAKAAPAPRAAENVNITIHSDKLNIESKSSDAKPADVQEDTRLTPSSNQAGLVRVAYSNRAGGHTAASLAVVSAPANIADEPASGIRYVDHRTTTAAPAPSRTALPSNVSHTSTASQGVWY
ncbi:MAG: hypothetical protein KF858_10945 [Candidatus Sumerlaeia bacterium]|nr:hypothetical protein [Candidatus Sumerlaeia bacterium]